MSVEEVKGILTEVLALDGSAAELKPGTRLFGSLPELDSLAVLEVVQALEDRYGFTIEGEELNADVFETLGSLAEFVEAKQAQDLS